MSNEARTIALSYLDVLAATFDRSAIVSGDEMNCSITTYNHSFFAITKILQAISALLNTPTDFLGLKDILPIP